MTRQQIMEMGLIAMQAGIQGPAELQVVIRRGVLVEWRVPLAVDALNRAQLALQGMTS